jgi:hypothetical protein
MSIGNGNGGACEVCKGSGVVRFWSECLNFDDERFCQDCEAGRQLASRIEELVARTAAEDRGPVARSYHQFNALS